MTDWIHNKLFKVKQLKTTNTSFGGIVALIPANIILKYVAML